MPMTRPWGRAAVAAGLCVALGMFWLAPAGCQAGRPGGLSPLNAATVAIHSPAPAEPAVLLAAPTTAAAQPVPPSPAASSAGFPVPIVELRGKGADLGSAHGRRLSAQ